MNATSPAASSTDAWLALIAEAERALGNGDPGRARALLRLLLRLVPVEDRATLLSHTGPLREALRGTAAWHPAPAAAAEPVLLATLRFPPLPPQGAVGDALATINGVARPSATERTSEVPGENGHRRSGSLRRPLTIIAVLVLAWGAAWESRLLPEGTRAGVQRTARRLGIAPAAGNGAIPGAAPSLILAEERLAAGDTAAGVALLIGAATAPNAVGTTAWSAAERLASLSGPAARRAAADAYLRALALGGPLPPGAEATGRAEMVETVARAQVRAGFPERAARVRAAAP